MTVIRLKIKKKGEGRRLHINYTTICHYCGEIFGSNRSTAKCCEGHRQLLKKYGPNINSMVHDKYGILFNADELLGRYYNISGQWKDGWCTYQCHLVLRDEYGYNGPVPIGAELMVVGSYILKVVEDQYSGLELCITVKPITALTKKERRNTTFIKGEFPTFITHDYYSPDQMAQWGVQSTKTVEESKREEEHERQPIENYIVRGTPLKNFQKKESPHFHPTPLQAMTDLLQSFYKQPFLEKPVKIKRTIKQNDT